MIVAILLLASASAAAPPPSASVEDLLEAGKLDQAVSLARSQVLAKPDDVERRLAAAKALAARARRFEKVVEVQGSPSDLASGKVKVTKDDLDTATLSPTYDAAMYEEALLNLSEGIRRAPTRKDLRSMQLFLLTDGARIERASAALRDAVAKLPKEPGLAAELARFGAERTRCGDAAGGAQMLGIVADAFPEDAAVRADHGLSLARLGRKDEALAALDRAVASAPKDLRILRLRATAALILREYPRARSAYEAAFAAGRQDQDRFAAAVAAYGVDPAASKELFQELATPTASSPPAMIALAADFATAAAQGPASAAASNLAKKVVDGKQELLAIPLLDRYLKAKPGDRQAQERLSAVYRALGSPSLAAAVSKGR
jgi:tetratricopeptide (TPR) repeat protein